MKLLLLPVLFLVACVPVAVETTYYDEYCGTGDVYQCGEYVRVMGEQNRFYIDGEELDCGAQPEACEAASHETCTLMHECQKLTLCDEPRSEVCTLDYRPVCARVDTGIRCITTPCPSTEERTYSNACSACSDEKVIGYTKGACDDGFEREPDKLVAICDNAPEWVDTTPYQCVDSCPADYDSFGTQIGLMRCIPHLGEDYFEKRSGCLRTTDNCECVKVEHATDGTPLDVGYRCVENEEYQEYLIHTSGLCKKDRIGIESCAIA